MSTSITRIISQDLYEALVNSGGTGADPLVTQADLDGAIEVIEAADFASLPVTGETSKLYVTLDTNNIYRWDGAAYVQVGDNGAGVTNLGYTASPTNGTVTSDTGTDATLPLVDAVNAGLMAPADKSKLDGIESGATADQNASEVPVTPLGNLTSTDVQAALQELQGDIDAISDTDDQTATEVPVTPVGDLTSTNVQSALEELQGDIDTLETSSHAALTLDTDLDTTGQAASLTGQELELKKATPTTDGVMSSEDKSKLDGIEAGATGDQSATEVPVTPTGDLTSTNVQDALAELQGDIDTLESSSHDALTLGGVVGDTTDDTLDLTGQSLTVNLATATTDGAMSAADKSKLDGVEAGAAADQNASEVPVTPNGNLTSTDVQSALQELQGDIDAFVDTDNQTAAEVPYTNTTSGLTAVDVQAAIDEIESRVDANDAKVSNVTTDLSITNKTATTLDVASSDGTDATVPAATITEAGLMTSTDKVKLDGIEAGATGDQSASEVPVTPSGDLTSTDVQSALQELQGDIDNLETNQHDAATLAIDATTTDTLGITGQEFKVNLATNLTAGAMSSTDKAKLDGIESGATADQNSSEVPYDNTVSGLTATDVKGAIDELDAAIDALPGGHDAVTLGGIAGDTTDDTLDLTGQVLTVNLATTTTDGAMSSADKTKLDGVSGTNTGDQVASGVPVTPTGNLTSTDVQAALVELQGDIDGIVDTDDQTASEVPYSNTTSGLTATNVQTALDEIEARVDTNDAKVSNVTTNLSVGNKTANTLDVISSDGTDATIPGATITEAGLLKAADKAKLDGIETNAAADQNASEVPYTNTTSGLTATDVQAAIDELDATIDGLPAGHDAVTLGGVANDTTDDTLDLVGQVLTVNLATQTTDGALSATDKTKIDNLLATKSKNVAIGAFTGNPKTAAVVFDTAFPDANYSIILTAEVDNANASYVLTFLNKTASGFTISTGTNSTANLLSVDWTAIYYGES